MRRLIGFTTILLLVITFSANSQWAPRPNALLLSDSLVFSGTLGITHSTVTYNPIAKKYYSLRIGNNAFPLQTWNLSGGVAIYSDTCGIDSRGIWWNPNTNQLERNCFNTLGWATIGLNASQNAINSYTMLFTGMRQPNVQSVGAYDYNTNSVIFYDAGSISTYNRNTGNLISTMPLTGTSLTNICAFSVIYTGQTGYEIGILDYVTKTVLLFNRFTGVFTGSSQLPATAVTNSQFRFCYANNRVWLFNSTFRKWNAYNIWNVSLPIDLLSFTATLNKNNHVECQWITASEINNDYFTLERSRDTKEFEEIAVVRGAGNSTEVLSYSYTDENPFSGVSYYRLKQTDFDGRFSYSDVVAVNLTNKKTTINIFPNPATSKVNISVINPGATSLSMIEIIDATGRMIYRQPGDLSNDENLIELNVAALPEGIYTVQLINSEATEQKKIVIQ